MGAGKGDSPRNNYSQKFRTNFQDISWEKQKSASENLDKNEQTRKIQQHREREGIPKESSKKI